MKRLIAGALLAGTAMSAQAADLPARVYTKAPMMATVYDWTGFYLGVNAGGGVGRDRTTQSIPPAGGSSFDTLFQQPSGVIGGGQIGYNWQTNMGFLGPVLFGVEADIQGAGLRDNFSSLTNAAGTSIATYNDRLDWFGTVRGRVGLVTGATVGYVTGGYAYGNVRNSVTETVAGVPATFATSQMRGGYTLGSGVEAALGGNWTGKIEYLYVNLGNRTDAFTLQGVPQTQTTQYRENIFRAGLNYRIGGTALNPTPANWNGLYVGGNFGSGITRDRTTVVNGIVAERFNLSREGYSAGGQLGYNWQASAWVFGVEGDFQGTAQRDKSTCVISCSGVVALSYDAKLPWFATARGRLGYSVGSTLFYATGGYAVAEVKTAATVSAFGVAGQNSFTTTKSGWTVGGGIETPFTLLGLFGPNWTTKTEYLYADLGAVTNTFTPAIGGAVITQTQRINEHIFRTGINYHFNSPVVARY